MKLVLLIMLTHTVLTAQVETWDFTQGYLYLDSTVQVINHKVHLNVTPHEIYLGEMRFPIKEVKEDRLLLDPNGELFTHNDPLLGLVLQITWGRYRICLWSNPTAVFEIKIY